MNDTDAARQEALQARLAHAEALRRWHRREPPYDDPRAPAPMLDPKYWPKEPD